MNKEKIRYIASRTLSIITAPFSRALALMCTLVVLIVVPQMLLWPFVGTPLYSIMVPYKLAQAILIAWVILLPYCYLPRFRQLYMGIVMGAFLVFTATDTFFLLKFHDEFNMLFVGFILGTNPNEILEFAQSIIRPEIWLGLAAIIAGVIGLYLLLHRLLRRVRLNRWISLSLLLASAITAIIMVKAFPSQYNRYSLLPVKMVVNREHLQLSKPIEQHDVKITPLPDAEQGPKPNIVVIVGESLNRDMMSIYGYDKDTNPRLSALISDSLLIPYTHVDAADTHTIHAFKRFMGTFDKADVDDEAYSTQTTIIDLARSDGYFTAWASNQSMRGIFDNVISEFARTTDYPRWTNEELMESLTKCYFDETVVPLVDSVLEADAASGKPLLAVVHLMGNHSSFYHRYPQYADHFKPEQYEKYPESQRKIRAYYDNATRYNDRVVYDIMKRFDGTPTVVIYFSDHGLDFFHTSPDHFDHAKPGNAESERYARRIPFLVYTTPEYKAAYPRTTAHLRSLTDKPMDTTDLIYYIADILGITFEH